MKSDIQKRLQKRASGVTMVEMLITVVVMSISSMAIFGLLITTMSTSKRLNNKLDSIDTVRNALERIAMDVREARNLGEIAGAYNPVTETNSGSATFPSAGNPTYGNGAAPPGGWPWSGMSSYNVNNQNGRLLVVQLPIFDNDGFPTIVPGSGRENVETHIYRVVPDTENGHEGEWMLQWVKIPGVGGIANCNYVPGNVRPNREQTLAKGIIGPMEGNSPKVFTFLHRLDPTPRDDLGNDPLDIANYTGVIAALEVVQHKNTSRVSSGTTWRQYKTPSVLSVKETIFIRNNGSVTALVN